MSATYGTFRLIYEDASWFLGKLLLLYITAPLTAAWIIIRTSFDMDKTLSSISSPRIFSLSRSMGSWGSKAFYLLLSALEAHELKC